MTVDTIAVPEKRSFFRKLLRGLGFMLIGVVVLAFWSWLLGGAGAAIGVIAMIGLFIEGYRGRSLSDIGASKPTTAMPAGASGGGVIAAPQPPRRRGLSWKVPLAAVGGVFALAGVAAIFAPDKPSKARPTTTEAKKPAVAPEEPASKYKSFSQRPCSGMDDCTRANIEAEQTEASRLFNKTARDSFGQAVRQLGPPTYVLRSGDVVDVEEYQRNPTEMGFAEVIIAWANGPCAPNEVHLLKRGDLTIPAPMPGGTSCTRDGSSYPLPPPKFRCDGGRRNDPLCSVSGVLKLPGMGR